MKRLSLVMILLLGSSMIASAWTFSEHNARGMQWSNTVVQPAPYASCVAWGDINSDGYPDLFVGSNNGAHCQLFLNSENGEFRDASDAWDMQRLSNVRSAQFVDYNNDGMLDLFCITENSVPIELYKQTANTRLVRVQLDLPASDLTAVTAAVWSDIDGDGELDLIVNEVGEVNGEMVVLNTENNLISLARDSQLPEGIADVSKISMIDYNLDGYLDILASTGNGNSKFYVNNGSEYVDKLNDLGLVGDVGAEGIAWADFNHDSYLDFATCGTSILPYLYMGYVHGGEIAFHDVLNESEAPLNMAELYSDVKGATSVHAIDANMDGWTDLFYVKPNGNGNILLMNIAGERWSYDSRINQILNSGEVSADAAAWADVDGDGDLDLALTNGEHGVMLFTNDLAIRHEYFSISLADYTTDTPMLNCQVVAKFENSSRQWATTSMANTSIGFDNMVCTFVNPTISHSRVLELSVIWPSGATSTYGINDVNMWGETTLRPPRVSTGGLEDDPIDVPEENSELAVTLASSPNPFNPSTTLNYTVAEAGFVELRVVNVLGQEVMNLMSGYQDAGVHTVYFDASNLPSGLYIAQLTTAGQTMLHRMILTK